MADPALRALIVSYIFPPVGGAGVQRIVKLTKYLPEHGVRPAVLSVKNPSVPLIDTSLLADIPEGIEVLRTRTLEPGYGLKRAGWSATAGTPDTGLHAALRRPLRQLTGLMRQLLVPDAQILWQATAQPALLMRLLGEAKDQVVFISGPPFSQFLLCLLPHLLGRAVVLDYRDEWSTYRDTYEMAGSRLARAVGDPLEAALLRRAECITTATSEFRDALIGRFPFLDPARVHVVENGYDPDDFPKDLPEPQSGRFVLTYAGTLFKLTSPRGLLGAIRRLHRDQPELARLLEVRFIGRVVDTELPAFSGMEEMGVRRIPYIDHHEVLGALAQSHMVLCLLDEVEGVERIYPGKIFELMHLRRPLLVLAPEGALTRLCGKHRLGHVLAPRDEEGIARFLAHRLREFSQGVPITQPQPLDIERYHRRATAGRFASVMRQAAAMKQHFSFDPGHAHS